MVQNQKKPKLDNKIGDREPSFGIVSFLADRWRFGEDAFRSQVVHLGGHCRCAGCDLRLSSAASIFSGLFCTGLERMLHRSKPASGLYVRNPADVDVLCTTNVHIDMFAFSNSSCFAFVFGPILLLLPGSIGGS